MKRAIRRTHLLVLVNGLWLCSSAASQTNPSWKPWYQQPAQQWVEALRLGNGRLGAMVFGGVGPERLQLDEGTLWSGGPREWNNPEARIYLPQVRKVTDKDKTRLPALNLKFSTVVDLQTQAGHSYQLIPRIQEPPWQ